MDIDRAKRAFAQQQRGAKRRGIAFELTFDQWLSWWGADIAIRGNRRGYLQMCRPLDTGPYALGNIYKGTPLENSKTAGKMKLKRASDKAKREHQAQLDALIWAESKEARDDLLSDDDIDRLKLTGAIRGWNDTGAAFVVDKDL